MIGFWIFKCLWNHLIKTLLVGGSGGGKTAKTAVKWSKIIRFWILKCLWNHLIEMLQLGRGLEGSLFLGGWSLGAEGPAVGPKGPLSPLQELEIGGP